VQRNKWIKRSLIQSAPFANTNVEQAKRSNRQKKTLKLQLPLTPLLDEVPTDAQVTSDLLDRLTSRTIASSKDLIVQIKQMQADADERVDRWLTRTEQFIDRMKD